jgi:hypothetical protein
VGIQNLLQHVNRQEVTSRRSRPGHPFRGGGRLLFLLPGEEFANRSGFRTTAETIVGRSAAFFADLKVFQLSAERNGPARLSQSRKALQKRFTASRRKQELSKNH